MKTLQMSNGMYSFCDKNRTLSLKLQTQNMSTMPQIFFNNMQLANAQLTAYNTDGDNNNHQDLRQFALGLRLRLDPKPDFYSCQQSNFNGLKDNTSSFDCSARTSTQGKYTFIINLPAYNTIQKLIQPANSNTVYKYYYIQQGFQVLQDYGNFTHNFEICRLISQWITQPVLVL